MRACISSLTRGHSAASESTVAHAWMIEMYWFVWPVRTASTIYNIHAFGSYTKPAGSAAASWASGKEEEEDEAEEVPLHKPVEEAGGELTNGETRIKKHQDNDSAGCGGGRELGGGRSSTGDGDGAGDRDDGINDRCGKISHSQYALVPYTVLLACSGTTQHVFLDSRGEDETENGCATIISGTRPMYTGL